MQQECDKLVFMNVRARTRSRHFLMMPVGSSGDVHPYLGLGRELRQRGHDVTLLAGEPFDQAARALDLEFISIWDSRSYEEVTRNPDLWNTRKGLAVVLGIVSKYIREAYALIGQHYQPGRTVLVGHTLSYALRVFEEVHHAPAATIQLAPLALRSNYDQFVAPPGIDLSRLPVWAKRILWWLSDYLFIDPMIVPELNRFRHELGLLPVHRVFKQWLNSPQAIIGLFPEWFGPRQPDWPPQLHLTSFPLYDEADVQPLSESLEHFLNRGEPPIVFTAGTGNAQAGRFFAVAAQSVALLGKRALLLTRTTSLIPPSLPNSIHHVPYAPFSLLLPRCAAIVHHGGIGTCAQSLAAGIPQLISPLNFDQPDNARRIQRLGAGKMLMKYLFTPRRVATELKHLLEDKRTKKMARHYANQLHSENGISRTCDILEGIRIG